MSDKKEVAVLCERVLKRHIMSWDGDHYGTFVSELEDILFGCPRANRIQLLGESGDGKVGKMNRLASLLISYVCSHHKNLPRDVVAMTITKIVMLWVNKTVSSIKNWISNQTNDIETLENWLIFATQYCDIIKIVDPTAGKFGKVSSKFQIKVLLSSTCVKTNIGINEFIIMIVRVGVDVPIKNVFKNTIILFVCRNYLEVSSVAGELSLVLCDTNSLQFGQIWLCDCHGKALALGTNIFQCVIPEVTDLTIREAFAHYGNHIVSIGLVRLPLVYWADEQRPDCMVKNLESRVYNTVPGNYYVRYNLKSVKIVNGFGDKWHYMAANTASGNDNVWPSWRFVCFQHLAPLEYQEFIISANAYINNIFDGTFFESPPKDLKLPQSATEIKFGLIGKQSLVYAPLGSDILVVKQIGTKDKGLHSTCEIKGQHFKFGRVSDNGNFKMCQTISLEIYKSAGVPCTVAIKFNENSRKTAVTHVNTRIKGQFNSGIVWSDLDKFRVLKQTGYEQIKGESKSNSEINENKKEESKKESPKLPKMSSGTFSKWTDIDDDYSVHNCEIQVNLVNMGIGKVLEALAGISVVNVYYDDEIGPYISNKYYNQHHSVLLPLFDGKNKLIYNTNESFGNSLQHNMSFRELLISLIRLNNAWLKLETVFNGISIYKERNKNYISLQDFYLVFEHLKPKQVVKNPLWKEGLEKFGKLGVDVDPNRFYHERVYKEYIGRTSKAFVVNSKRVKITDFGNQRIKVRDTQSTISLQTLQHVLKVAWQFIQKKKIGVYINGVKTLVGLTTNMVQEEKETEESSSDVEDEQESTDDDEQIPRLPNVESDAKRGYEFEQEVSVGKTEGGGQIDESDAESTDDDEIIGTGQTEEEESDHGYDVSSTEEEEIIGKGKIQGGGNESAREYDPESTDEEIIIGKGKTQGGGKPDDDAPYETDDDEIIIGKGKTQGGKPDDDAPYETEDDEDPIQMASYLTK